MNTRAAAQLAASMLLAITYPCLQEAHAQDDNNNKCIVIPQRAGFRLDILVDGSPLEQIRRHGRTYVEAPWDKDFEIKITCPSSRRYLAVCSVDGLSIMNGKTASSLDDGYVIENGNLTVPGFRLNGSNVAHFRFGDKSTSYAKLMGKPTNIGVIGLKIFADANQHSVPHCYIEDDYLPPPPISSPAPPTHMPYISESGSAGSSNLHQSYRKAMPSPQIIDSESQGQSSPGTAANAAKMAGDELAVGGVAPGYCCDKRATDLSRLQSVRGPLDHDMGTKFGANTLFLTHDVNFERGAQVANFAIEYASHEKLVQAGIIPGTSLPSHPNPFPADSTGCTPPPGWRG